MISSTNCAEALVPREASNKQSFYAHGKLLLTSEYLILDGAVGLGLPTRLGQHFEVAEIENGSGKIHWKSYDSDGSVWLDSELQLNDLKPGTDSPEGRLSQLFEFIKQHSEKLSESKDYIIETKLEFNRKFGLGSSSTLLYNLGQWTEIDPFKLSDASFGGSGYDIACAGAPGPILYQRKPGGKSIKPWPYLPPFRDKIFFAYSGQKKNSREGIQAYRELTKKGKKIAIEQATRITQELLKVQDLETFEDLLYAHEQLISDVIDQPTILESEYSDFWGLVKSLGAWGGDFLLFTCREGRDKLEQYLQNREIGPIFSYDELILS